MQNRRPLIGDREPLPGSFLDQLTPDEQAVLRDAGNRRRHHAGTTLFHHGDPSKHVVVLETGWVKVTVTRPQGWEALLAIRGAGDIIGELSALDTEPRMATVTALTEISCVVVTAERFERCLEDSWPIARALIRHLAANLRESDRRRALHGQSNGDARLIGMLHELALRHGVPDEAGVLIDLPLSQQDLASSVGLSREVAARTMRLLRDRGVVTTARRRIVVRRPDLLEALSRSVSMSTDRR